MKQRRVLTDVTSRSITRDIKIALNLGSAENSEFTTGGMPVYAVRLIYGREEDFVFFTYENYRDFLFLNLNWKSTEKRE